MKLIDWFNKPKEEASAVENLTVQTEELEKFKASALEANGQLEAALTEVAALKAQVLEKDAQISELTNTVTSLEKKPAAGKSAVAHEGDQASITQEEEKEMTSWEMKAAEIKNSRKK